MQDLKNCFSLSGKAALVTGAGSGIGQAIAIAFAQFGASVAVVDIDDKGAASTVSEITSDGGAAFVVKCDVTDSAQVSAVVDKAIAKFGKLDILVNSAGIGMRSPAENMTDEMWDRVIDINLKGAFLFCRAAGRHMIARGEGGRIINVSSIAGTVGVETGNANYAATKGGMNAMTRCLAIEWAKHNILVNSLAPSHTKTALIEKLMQEKPETAEYFLNNIPLGRLADVEDIAAPAVFLASKASAFITGQVILADGGHTAK